VIYNYTGTVRYFAPFRIEHIHAFIGLQTDYILTLQNGDELIYLVRVA
jgi:hypothetical protein